MKKWFYKLLNITILSFLVLLTCYVNSNAQIATVTTDKLDYWPGETVVITGSGFEANETVTILIEHLIYEHADETWNVTADASGNIYDNSYVIDENDIGETFLLTATGGSSGLTAETYFTDGTAATSGNGALTVSTSSATPAFLCNGGTNRTYKFYFDAANKDWSTGSVLTINVPWTVYTSISTSNTHNITVGTISTTSGGAGWTLITIPFVTTGSNGDFDVDITGVTMPSDAVYQLIVTTYNPGQGVAASIAVPPTIASSNIYAGHIIGGSTNCGTFQSGSIDYIGTGTIIKWQKSDLSDYTTTPWTWGAWQNINNTSNKYNFNNNSISTLATRFRVIVSNPCSSADVLVAPDPEAGYYESDYATFARGTQPIVLATNITSYASSTVTFGEGINVNVFSVLPVTSVVYYLNYGTPSQTVITSPYNFGWGTATTVTVYALNDCANNTGTFTVTTGIAPKIACPENIIHGTDPGVCQAIFAIPLDWDGEGITATPTIPGHYIGTPEPIIYYSFNGSDPWIQWPSDNKWLVPKGDPTTIYLKATNAAGSSPTCSFTVTVVDDEAPTFTKPADITIYTDVDCQYDASVTATGDVTNEADNCSTGLQATSVDVTVDGTCVGSHIITRTWSLVDDAGNAAPNQVQTITVLDNTPPVWTTAPDNKIVECDGQGNLGDFAAWLVAPSGKDNCSIASLTTNFDPENIDDFWTAGDCGNTGYFTVTFYLTDECQNQIESTKIFTIKDETDPVWTLAKTPVDAIVECDGQGNTAARDAWLAAPEGTDVCGTATMTNDFDETTSWTQQCGGTGYYTVTFYLTDECLNQIESTKTFTIKDETDPYWTTAPVDMIVECDGQGNTAALAAWLAAPGGDDVCGTAAMTHTEAWTQLCGGTGYWTAVFTLTDQCGNDITETKKFTIKDETDPYWTTPPVDMTVECDGNGNTTELNNWLESFQGTDVCGTAIQTNNFLDLSDDCGATGSALVTFTLKDACGNFITKDATFAIVDTQAPSLSCPGDILNKPNDPGDCSADLTISAPNATDNCDPNVIIVNSRINNLVQNGDFNSGDSHWEDCSNTAEVNIEDFYIVPIPIPSRTNKVAEVDAEVSLCQNINGFTVGQEYILTFKATRRQNISTPNPVKANVIIDGGVLSKVVTRTNTTFNLTPEAFRFTATQTTHQLKFTPNSNSTSLGLVVDDIAIQNVSGSPYSASGTYPVGETQVVWNAIDACGNISSCTQKITVIDNEKPVITTNGDKNVNNDEGLCSAVVSVSADANDNCEVGDPIGVRSDALALTDPYPVGITTITWTVTDIHGNDAIPVIQTVTVNDIEPPVINCSADIIQPNEEGLCSATLTVTPPNASDNCNQSVVVVNSFNNNLVTNGDFNSGVANWQECNNTAEVETEDHYVCCPPVPSSNYDAEIDDQKSLCQNISGFTVGKEYILTFKASRRQNTNDFVPNPVGAWVKVIDGSTNILNKHVQRTNTTFALTLVGYKFTATASILKLSLTPDTDNNYSLGFVVDDISIIRNDITATFPVGTKSITWTAIDQGGNTTACTQTVTVNDEEDPTITCPATITKETDAGMCYATITDLGTPTTWDNCDVESVTNDFTTQFPDNHVPFGVHTITWTITDIHGNSNTCEQTINVNKVTTVTTVTVIPVAPYPTQDGIYPKQQYSDKVTFTATVTNCPDANPSGSNLGWVDFYVGSQLMGGAYVLPNGTATLENIALLEPWPFGTIPIGQMAPGNHTVKAVFTPTTGNNFIGSYGTTTLTITPEDADITYNGDTYFTVSPNNYTGMVLFSAYVVDRNDAPPVDNGARGDIRNADITFSDAGNVLGTVNVGLINPSITTDGNASLSKYVTLNNSQISLGGITYEVWTASKVITTAASNYYQGAIESPTIVTLAIPGGDYVTGGGHTILTSKTSGQYAGTPGKKMNFGLVMKWNKSGKNLQGNINVIYRGPLTYNNIIYPQVNFQIKSNAINSLAITTLTEYKKATITTKANLKAILPDGTEISLGGNHNLTMTVWESTTQQNGSLDKISVQLLPGSGAGVLFSSYWDAGVTKEQLINGGKIQVRGGIQLKGGTGDEAVAGNELSVYPNPFHTTATVRFSVADAENVNIIVTNSLGIVVRELLSKELSAGDYNLTWDGLGTNEEELSSGVYFITLTTGSFVKTVPLTLIK